MKFPKILLAAIVVLGIVAAVAVNVPAVQDRLIGRVIRTNIDNHARVAQLFADDALRLLVCGSSSPLPSPDRARPCLAVIAGGRFYVVDTGSGSWNTMALLRMPGERIGAVFFTHYHSDHIGDLGELNMQTWVAGRPMPLPVYGPAGVESVVAGFQQAYALDAGYRTAHHGADFLPPALGMMQAHVLTVPDDGTPATAFEDGALKVSVFAVDHAPIHPAVGYRFDYKGRSLVISGDTVKTQSVIDAARGADLLAHEAQNNDLVKRMHDAAELLGRTRYAKIFHDIPSYHTTPVEAAEVANAAGVPLLLMYHLTPPPPNRIAERVFLRGVSKIRDHGVVLARDGMLIELPLAGGEARVSELR
ncbi:MBL fold metallo-hydrolase [Solimonas terrae]|uniref:MBL fold metallo-hydrolase n=1 Tax=Solimonas terrae TaxID=1396819 RepID=A0A6M2BNN4_9GAMM|nr:MBL fold metallo-hydrolase [Solimonas terrae]NGY03825.1 MBL fold metallo-hydrolase [Solimonas terrae]